MYGGMRNFNLGDSLLKEVALGKEVIIINDLGEYLAEHPQSRRTKTLLEEGLRSTMMVPLIINNVTRGFLVFNSMEANAFNSEHSFFIRSISGQISFSIQRAELLDQLELHTKTWSTW
jgi:transcriptional regulator with GAF, ATPase, and Fis domain